MSVHGAVAVEIDQTEPVGDVLARIEAELEAIAHAVDANQAHIAAAIGAAAVADPAYASAVQEADLLSQKVAGIASFLRAIALELSPEWRVDATAAVRALKLAELAHRLGAQGRGEHAHDDIDYGHCDLF